ncbi:hypothetical protein D3C84_1287760 [compost metagenome]
MPRQLQTVAADMLRGFSLPVSQHALVQERIGAQQGFVENGQRNIKARMRSL